MVVVRDKRKIMLIYAFMSALKKSVESTHEIYFKTFFVIMQLLRKIKTQV